MLKSQLFADNCVSTLDHAITQYLQVDLAVATGLLKGLKIDCLYGSRQMY